MFRESCDWFLKKIQEMLEYNKSSEFLRGKRHTGILLEIIFMGKFRRVKGVHLLTKD